MAALFPGKGLVFFLLDVYIWRVCYIIVDQRGNPSVNCLKMALALRVHTFVT